MLGNLCTKGPFEMENTLTIHTQHCLYLTVKLDLSNTTESNISDNNEWKSFQLSLCICAVYSPD